MKFRDQGCRSLPGYFQGLLFGTSLSLKAHSLRNLRDLERVMVESAVICLVLPDRRAPSKNSSARAAPTSPGVESQALHNGRRRNLYVDT